MTTSISSETQIKPWTDGQTAKERIASYYRQLSADIKTVLLSLGGGMHELKKNLLIL